MNKKTYEEPSVKVVKLRVQHSLLVQSNPKVGVNDYDMQDYQEE